MKDFWPIVNWTGTDGTGNVNAPDALNEGYGGAANADWSVRDWVGAGGGPWYWYVPTQQPLCWSYYAPPDAPADELPGDDPTGVSDDEASEFAPYPWQENAGLVGFQLLAHFPILMIIEGNIAENGGSYYGRPIPEVGFASLDDAARHGQPDAEDFLAQQVPNGGFDQIKGAWGLLGPGGAPAILGSPMTEPPQNQSMLPWSALLADVGFGGFVPNIWQLTGLPQPPLTNPSRPWNPLNNLYTNPGSDLAKQAAQKFAKMWNDASNSLNEYEAKLIGQTYAPLITIGEPPQWDFAVPFIDIAAGLGGVLNFNAGNPIGIFKFAPIELPAATGLTIAVGQLDPKTWDTSHFPPTLKHP